MREMKDSGVAWIGEIPEEWEILNLKTVAYIQTGSTPAKSEQNIYYSTEDGIPWIKAENLGSFSPISKTKEYLTKEGELEGRIFPENTVFICCIASIGKVGYSQIKCSCNQQINGLVFNSNMFWKYGFYLSVSQEELYSVYASGNVMKIINSERQSRLLCTVPPLNEQQAIATYLDQKCTQIDALITNQQKQIERLKAYKQSLITEIVTKGLNPDVPMKDSGVEWIGEIPEDFSVQNIRSLFKIKKDIIGHEPDTVLSITQSGIKIKDISENNGQMADSYANYQIVNIGDFAMNHMDLLTGGIGISQYNGVTSPDYRVFNLKDNKMNPRYFLYIFETYYRNKIFYAFGQGAANLGRWRLPAKNFYSIYTPVAPIEEQQAIVSYLDQKCTQIDKLISIKQKKIEKLQQYKKSLIYEYVTGKKEVK